MMRHERARIGPFSACYFWFGQ